MSGFIPITELARMTGYRPDQYGWILRGLKKRGIRIFTISARGEPIVRWSDVESKKNVQTVEPNLERVT